MNVNLDKSIESGLLLFAQKRGAPIDLILRQRVSQQINDAQPPWREGVKVLRAANHLDVTDLLEALWPDVLPHLIMGHDVSPVNHIAEVVRFMADIVVGERICNSDVKRAVLAALFHDIGIGNATLPKITEEMIALASEDDKQVLRRKGIASRREHMDEGVVIAKDILRKFKQRQPECLSAEDICIILDIVGTHDNSKIALMEKRITPRWLLSPSSDDWLSQLHWEADALWMLSPAGILVDLRRQKEDDTPENRLAKLSWNLHLHGNAVDIYRKAYSASEFASFRFRKGLLYRSNTGFKIASRLVTTALQEYVPKLVGGFSSLPAKDLCDETTWDAILIPMLQHYDASAVQTAAHIVGLRADAASLPALLCLTKHSHEGIRKAAAVAYRNLYRLSSHAAVQPPIQGREEESSLTDQ